MCRWYPPTSLPQTPATSTFMSAASTGISGSAISRSSVSPEAIFAATKAISAIIYLLKSFASGAYTGISSNIRRPGLQVNERTRVFPGSFLGRSCSKSGRALGSHGFAAGRPGSILGRSCSKSGRALGSHDFAAGLNGSILGRSCSKSGLALGSHGFAAGLKVARRSGDRGRAS
jgi:hypothetical protein